MLATVFCFISLDTLMKDLLQTYSLVQVTWARFFFATIVACRCRRSSLAYDRQEQGTGLAVLRSLLLALTTGIFNAGVRLVPLATATTIMFLSPHPGHGSLHAIAQGTCRPRRWIGVLIGFLGALIVVRPWESHAGLFLGGAGLLLIAGPPQRQLSDLYPQGAPL